jgi:hypothetical protein
MGPRPTVLVVTFRLRNAEMISAEIEVCRYFRPKKAIDTTSYDITNARFNILLVSRSLCTLRNTIISELVALEIGPN